MKDVSFGWGIVGRLYKGGIYEIAQTQLSPGKWRITTIDIDLKGKMFLFNSFSFQRKELNSRFHPVSSDMTFQAAVRELLAAPEQEKPQSPPKQIRAPAFQNAAQSHRKLGNRFLSTRISADAGFSRRARNTRSFLSVAGKRRRNEVIQRRAQAYSTERIDNATTTSNTPGRIGRNKPTAPSISRTQPATINARRFTM